MSGNNSNNSGPGLGTILAVGIGAVAAAGVALAAYLNSNDPEPERDHQQERRRSSATPKKKFEILMVGKSGVGKTSIVRRYLYKEYDPNHRYTLGAEPHRKNLNLNGQEVTLTISDTAGRHKFPLDTLFSTAHGVIFVYDVTDPGSLEHLRSLFTQCDNASGHRRVEKMVVGNKADKDMPRSVSKTDGQKLADEYEADYLETSARDDIDIRSVFRVMTNKISLNH